MRIRIENPKNPLLFAQSIYFHYLCGIKKQQNKMVYSKKLTAYCGNMLKNGLIQIESNVIMGSDLVDTVMENYENNRSITNDHKEALLWLNDFPIDTMGFYNHVYNHINPFEKPEHFMVVMVRNCMSDIVANISVLNEFWLDGLELVPTTIGMICGEIDGVVSHIKD